MGQAAMGLSISSCLYLYLRQINAFGEVLPLLTQLWGELGVGSSKLLGDWEHQLATCGGISAYSVMRSVQDSGQAMGYAVLSTRGLARNIDAMSKLLLETFDRLRLDGVVSYHRFLGKFVHVRYWVSCRMRTVLLLLAASGSLVQVILYESSVVRLG